MRSCPQRLRCFSCGLLGHLRHDCPDDRVVTSESDCSDSEEPDLLDDSVEDLPSEVSVDGSGELFDMILSCLRAVPLKGRQHHVATFL